MKHTANRDNRDRRARNQTSGERQPQARGGGHEAGSKLRHVLDDAARLIGSGQYQQALHLLNSAGNGEEVRNAKGVCLLRLGRIEEALGLYRNLVLKSGTMWMRPELPMPYKTNFCTALLLAGHAAGCKELLAEIDCKDHPSVTRLKATLARWTRELSWWQKLMWWVGAEPSHPVTLEFPPGEMQEGMPPAAPKSPANEPQAVSSP